MENEVVKKPEDKGFKPLSILFQFIIATVLLGSVTLLVYHLRKIPCDYISVYLWTGAVYAAYRIFTNTILLIILIVKRK